MLEILCWGKKHWILSWIIVLTIISIILVIIGTSESTNGIVILLFSVMHGIYVSFLFNMECEELEDKNTNERQKRRDERYKRYNNDE